MLVASVLQNGSGGIDFVGLIIVVVSLIFTLIMIFSMWEIFVKADAPGWAALIPIFNFWVLLELVGRPAWYILLLIFPFLNAVVTLIVFVDLAKSFGKSFLFGLGMVFLPIIFFPLLAFGDAQYVGPAAA